MAKDLVQCARQPNEYHALIELTQVGLAYYDNL